MKQTLIRITVGVLIVLLLTLGGFVAWAMRAAAPEAAALRALTPDATMQVEAAPWLAFAPAGEAPRTGLILYPGGRVDPRAYAAAAREIAAAGYRVVVVPMPLNLAVLGADRASAVLAEYPEVTAWAVGGHSLGGAMAANYAADAERPTAVRGLVLWAAYPAAGDDLSGAGLKVVSIYGTRDGLAGEADVLGGAARLPPDTRWVPIEGGNHAQFGAYGPQAGDQPATISAAAQRAAVVAATVALLEAVADEGR